MLHHLGASRSSLKPDHLLQTPDTFVRSPLPTAEGVQFIIHTAPQLRAGFTWMTAEFSAGSFLHEAPRNTERFLYVLEGELQANPTINLELDHPSSKVFESEETLGPGSFLYVPEDSVTAVRASTGAKAVVIEKPYVQAGSDPKERNCEFGKEAIIKPEPLAGDSDIMVRRLMPEGREWDFAVNTMTYEPGASLAQVEIHVMEHGLLMLEGGGIYRLGDYWYPVAAGDFIWMAPYCPQWFGALGKTPARYLIYKDWNRHPLDLER